MNKYWHSLFKMGQLRPIISINNIPGDGLSGHVVQYSTLLHFSEQTGF